MDRDRRPAAGITSDDFGFPVAKSMGVAFFLESFTADRGVSHEQHERMRMHKRKEGEVRFEYTYSYFVRLSSASRYSPRAPVPTRPISFAMASSSLRRTTSEECPDVLR